MKDTYINSIDQLNDVYRLLKAKIEKEGGIRLSVKSARKRTNTQNAALHKYCELLAEALNDAGYDYRTFFRDGIALPFDGDKVKKDIWKPIQDAVIGFNETSQANRVDYSKVYDVLNRHLIENKEVYVPWPSKDTLE